MWEPVCQGLERRGDGHGQCSQGAHRLGLGEVSEQAVPCSDGLWSSKHGPQTSGGGHMGATWAVKVSHSEHVGKGSSR